MSGEKQADGTTGAGKRLALVVGVNNAPKSRLSLLKFARQDAEDVADVLQKHCNFMLVNDKPFLEEQATSATIKATILDLLEQVEANDFLLFYFSGHGQPMDVEADRKEVYLGTHDFVEKQVERDENLHLSLKWLRDKLYQQMEAGKVLLVLDCCYGGNIWRGGPDPYLKELYVRLKYYFGEPGATTGASHKGLRLALTATGQNLPTREEQAHGRMTGFLLPVLRGEKPEAIGKGQQLTVLRLVDYLQSNYEQSPLPALSGDASQECVLATFAASQSEVTLPKVVLADRPQNYLPIKRNPYFQPRPGEFEQLERIIFASGTPKSGSLGLVGVTGMGGVGKTQLAAELAYRYQQRFPGGIFWMPATGQSLFDWQHTLADLAVKTSYFPPDDDSSKPEHEALRARHLCRYFVAHADVLVILDNVEVPQLVTTALADLAGGELACTVLYTSRQRTPLAGATLYSVEALSEEGALRLLLESTRLALLAEVQAGGTSAEIEAARQICRATGALPLALTMLQSLLARDRKLSLHTLATILQERGALILTNAGSQQATLTETFQLSWQQVRDERARRFFLLASLFPEATPIPLWLAGLAAGLGDRAQVFDPLWEINLSLQELSLLEGSADDQVRLHPLVRAFGQQMLQQEQEQGRILRAEAGSRLVDVFTDLILLEQRAQRTSYRDCLEQLRVARDYALFLDEPCADQLSHLEHWLDRESYLLADKRWWPETIPGLFYQQFFNREVETGKSLLSLEPPSCWLKQAESVRAEDPALLHIFAGHTGLVTSVAFSPDGSQILTGSQDRTARLWETSSGRVLVTLQGYTSLGEGYAFSPDESRVLTGSDDHILAILRSQATSVTSVAFSPDGSQILAGSDDQTARLWETSSGRVLATLQGHTGSVESVAFSPDGSQILTGSDDQTARLWETSSGRTLAILQGHTKVVESVAFSPDGSQILTGSMDQTARLWETSSGRVLATLQGHTGSVESVAFSPDGSQILTGSNDQTARLWEMSSGRVLATLQGHTDGVWSVAFSPDGSQILTGSMDQTARLWETSSGRVLATLQGHTGRVTSVAFSPDGSQILTGSQDGTARLWETSSDRSLDTSQSLTSSVWHIAFSPDGSQILTGSNDQTARLWETSSGRVLATLQGHTDSVTSVAFSPDGSRVLTGSYDQTARLWETSNGRTLATLQGHTNAVTSVTFSPNGSQILTESVDQTTRLWEASSGRVLDTLQSDIIKVTSEVFSPDGSQILTGSWDKGARLWEVSSGRVLVTLQGHTDWVESVAFSPDGSQILTGSKDQTARLWKTSSGRTLATLQGHTGSVESVAFSSDGQIAVTCDTHGWNFFWQVSEPRGKYPLGLYITAFQVKAVFWQDATHLLLADTGGTRGQPYIYRLSLEGSGWRE